MKKLRRWEVQDPTQGKLPLPRPRLHQEVLPLQPRHPPTTLVVLSEVPTRRYVSETPSLSATKAFIDLPFRVRLVKMTLPRERSQWMLRPCVTPSEIEGNARPPQPLRPRSLSPAALRARPLWSTTITMRTYTARVTTLHLLMLRILSRSLRLLM